MTDPFAKLLLRLREGAGRTQEEQADAINAVSGRDTMTRREISRYEKFENVPTNHTLAPIAVACGVPYEELLREAKAARARRRRGDVREEEDQDDVKRRKLLTATADTAVDRLGDELPDGGVVVLGDLASALLRGGDVEQGVYVSRQFTATSQAKPNTMGKERAARIATWLPDSERELAHHLWQFAS